MKKRKLKNYLKIGILLFGISFSLWNCEKESYGLEPNINQEFYIKNLGKKEILGNEKISKLTSKYRIKKEEFQYSSKNNKDNNTGIEINTDYVKYIEFENGYHSYTFTVTNSSKGDGLQNILLSLQNDGSYKEYLVQYNLSHQEITQIENGHEIDIAGKFTLIELEESNFASNLQAKVIYEDGCYYNTNYYPNLCKDNIHYFGQISEPPCVHLGTSRAAEPGGETITTLITCTGGGGGDPNDNNQDPNDTNNDSGLNPNGGLNDRNQTTTVINTCTDNCIEDEEDKKNCDELKKLTSDKDSTKVNKARQAIKDLQAKQPFSTDENSPEEGYSFQHTQNKNVLAPKVPGNNKYVTYPTRINGFGGAHYHQNNGYIVPMFSPKDVKTLFQFYNTYRDPSGFKDPNLFVHILVTEDATYAIKINNISKFSRIKEIISDKKKWRNFHSRAVMTVFKYYDKNSNKINGSDKDYQIKFLKFYNQNKDLGISLYIADNDLNNWTELTLDTSRPKNLDIIRTPCI